MSETTPDAALLETWRDERAITEVLHRYCRGVDRLDEALIASCYHEDGTDQHGAFDGLGSDFARLVVRVLRDHADATMHALSNVEIRLDGDLARCACQVVARHWREREGERRLETAGGRYLDRFERRDGVWRIARRIVVLDWGKVETVDEPFPMEGYPRGTRDGSDPSYAEI